MAAITIVNQRQFPFGKIIPYNGSVRSVSGHTLPVIGQSGIPFVIDDIAYPHDALILDLGHTDYDGIIGLEFLKNYNCTLYFGHGTINLSKCHDVRMKSNDRSDEGVNLISFEQLDEIGELSTETEIAKRNICYEESRKNALSKVQISENHLNGKGEGYGMPPVADVVLSMVNDECSGVIPRPIPITLHPGELESERDSIVNRELCGNKVMPIVNVTSDRGSSASSLRMIVNRPCSTVARLMNL